MKHTAFHVVAAAGLIALTSAIPAVAQENASDVEPFVVGGDQAQEGAYPWAARIRMPAEGRSTLNPVEQEDKALYAICTGTLLSPDILLTAQHCLDENPPEVQMFIGKVDWKQAEEAGQKRVGTKWKTGPGPNDGDWAVVKLDQPYDPGSFPVLPTDDSHDKGPDYRAIGWGKTAEDADHSSQFLMQVGLPFIDDAKCGLKNGNEICAGDWDNGGKDTCSGDSGGPLLHQADEEAVQVGITSWGIGCGRPQNPGHYTRTSTFTQQIQDAITELGGQPARTTNG